MDNLGRFSALLAVVRQKVFISFVAMLMGMGGAWAQGHLAISEVLFQPRSGEAEYVELYNPTDGAVELQHYHIVRWINDTVGSHYTLPQYSVAAHDYVVLTRNAASVEANYDVRYKDKVVECGLPPYPNDGGRVVLTLADSTIIESFVYTPDLHSRLLRNRAGVSLERRSFEEDVNAAGNWFSAASTAGYGTPGYANSQSSEWIAEEASFVMEEPIVSPDGDGYQDELTLRYTLDNGETYGSIEIYDAMGNRVRQLLNSALLGTHGEVRWDGKGLNGRALHTGRYVMIITLYDTVGTRQVIKRAVTVVN